MNTLQLHHEPIKCKEKNLKKKNKKEGKKTHNK